MPVKSHASAGVGQGVAHTADEANRRTLGPSFPLPCPTACAGVTSTVRIYQTLAHYVYSPVDDCSTI